MIRTLVYRLLIAAARLLARPRVHVHYRITVLKLDRLGDAVLSLGAVRALASVCGEDRMLLIVSGTAAGLFRHEFPKAGLLVMPAFCHSVWPDYLRFLIRYARTLRGICTDDLICLRHQHSDYLHSIASLVNTGRCHAARWEGNREHACLSFPRWTPTPYPRAGAAFCTELEAHRRLVGRFIGERSHEQVIPAMPTTHAIEGKVLLVCPVAGDLIRQYPADQLAEALSLFLRAASDTCIQVCLPPGSDCAPWNEALALRGIAAAKWTFPPNEMALAQVIAESWAVLAMESAPAHLATALDKPGVFLLGGGHHGMFAPWQRSARQKWLSHAMACYHCQWHCCQPEAYCITRIKPGAIAAELLSLEHVLVALDQGSCP